MRQRLTKGAILDRERQAVAYHLAGETCEAIAAALGYTNRGSAWHAIQRGLARFVAPAIEEARTAELARLDRLHKAVWTRATQGELPAIETALKIMARRARLLGLDQPVRVNLRTIMAQVTADLDLSPEETEATVRDLETMLRIQKVTGHD